LSTSTLLHNEADVEVQYIVPLLSRPELLAIPLVEIRSKGRLAPRNIGKGASQRASYIPDFCVYKKSIPLLVIEAKSPSVDCQIAYDEARLYATEINSGFPTKLNPCARILTTNGVDLLAGYWDARPSISVKLVDVVAGSRHLDELRNLIGNDVLAQAADALSSAVRAVDFRRPFNQGPGPTQIASKIEPNTFAADLSPVLRRFFTSRDQTTDPEIFSRAYISSNEITSYDKILESYLKDRLSKSKRRTEINISRRKAAELTKPLSNFNQRRTATGDIQIITGGVGVGKSLFARRYKEFLQPDSLRGRNHWAFIDFNAAGDDHNGWREWVCSKFCESLIEEGAPVNLRDEADQERVFASDLADRKAYYDRMERASKGRGALELARDLEAWRQDPEKLAKSLCRYFQGDRSENVIVVFDNVDRRSPHEQLSAFQQALWFMDLTRCLVVLQMRDSTFEHYKNEKPLDTYKTGQIFHISPPRFVDVVKKRLELSLEDLAEKAPELVRFQTKNGATISYPRSRAGEFLRTIYEELFQSPNNVSRVLEALAGRNVRKALDMFNAIITSGHMPEDIIASVAQGISYRSFPEYRIFRALMREDYRFFNNNVGFIANIFNCDSRWERPNNLLVPELLFYVISQRRVKGDNGQMGYLSFERCISHMESLGFVRTDAKDASMFCLQKGLIEVDTSSETEIREIDCVKASASGWAHMRILSSRLEYIASILPTTPMNDKALSSRIFERMQAEHNSGYISLHQSISLVEGFLRYLREQRASFGMHPGFSTRERSGTDYVIKKIEEALSFARRESNSISGQADLLDT